MKFPTSVSLIVTILAGGCSRWEGSEGTSRTATSMDTTAANLGSTEATLAADVKRVAERLSVADQFSGVVLLARHGKPIVRQAYGFADRDAKRANTLETPFALGSVSKMFTAVLVAQLVEQGTVSVEATIGSLLPNFPAGQAKSQVTVHHLLTMSSGIPDVWQLPPFWTALDRARTLSDFWPVFAMRPLTFTPGTQWTYSNSNFLVLGAIVEQQFGDFSSAAEQRIFQPAGMTHTGYQPPTSPRAARGYTRTRAGTQPDPRSDEQWSPAWEEPVGEIPVVHVPMGGGYSTVDDLARFANALMQAQLLGRETTERVTTGYVPSGYGGRHGYGFETRVLNGVRILGHRGGSPGVSNQVDFYPDLGYVFVVLGNSDASGAQEIASHVRASISGSPALLERRQ